VHIGSHRLEATRITGVLTERCEPRRHADGIDRMKDGWERRYERLFSR